MKRTGSSRVALAPLALLTLLGITGCESGPPTAPVSGVVTLDGVPLEFGYVMFQPNTGQPAQGVIQSDGSFELMSLAPGDGAQIGTHRVSVICNEGHRPTESGAPSGGGSLGRLLIPLAYTRGNMSGITADVPKEGLPDFRIELSSQGPGR